MKMTIAGTETTRRSVTIEVDHYEALDAVSHTLFGKPFGRYKDRWWIKDGGWYTDTSGQYDREERFERTREATSDEIAAYDAIKTLHEVLERKDKVQK